MMLFMDQKKIRIFSKKLSSGNCQVKFFLDSGSGKPYYGYMLATPGQKLSEVITRIYQKLHDIEEGKGYAAQKKAWISQKRHVEPGFMLFEDNS
jgi:hypothetical protein